jgi:isopentenyldiphosphate isomerase
MKDEIYDLIDDKDNIIGKATWTEVHTKGLLHQTCAAFIFKNESRKEILLQKRSHTMTQDPDKYSISVGGHIISGESPDMGIRKELSEELLNGQDLSSLTIEKVGVVDVKDIPQNHEHLHLYEIFYNGDFFTDPKEVFEAKWFRWEEFMNMLKESPEAFTNVSRICIKYYIDHMKDLLTQLP